MIKKTKKSKAQTLAEVMVMFTIIGIVVMATVGITKSKLDYAMGCMYYATFRNLKVPAGEMIADGCTSTDTTVCENGVVKMLPAKAHATHALIKDNGFCDRTADVFNTVGTVNCDPAVASTIASGTTDFSAKTPNFSTTNSATYYNFAAPPALYGAMPNVPENYYYTVYVDIDGNHRGKSLLNNDVMEFQITRAGKVLPAPASIAANDTKYLSTAVSYETFDTSKRVINWLGAKGRVFRDSACASGDMTGTYCNAVSTYPLYNKDATCNTNNCTLVVNAP